MMPADPKIVRYEIYPAIGIARVGNAPHEHYFAPEVPETVPSPQEKFKDPEGRIKRQIVRFRIYGFDANDRPVKEITSEDGCEITWRVHVANRKAIGYKFTNALDLPGHALATRKRNENFTGEKRQALLIDPGPKSITGKNVSGPAYHLNGYFFDIPVHLGELQTDERGRLLFFGGPGRSGPLEAGTEPSTFANNDGWYDDISDGPVRATVRIGEQEVEAEPAVVVVAPPNYGQGLWGTVTMYDVVYDLFARDNRFAGFTPPSHPNFYEHIYPIFKRMAQTQWVNGGFHFLFGPGSPYNFLDDNFIQRLADSSEAEKALRHELFTWFRDPDQSRIQRV